MHHSKYSYVKNIIESAMPVLLVGQAGSGKSTLLMQIATDLDLPFHSISCTKQMSVSALLGFISINGAYIPTQLRHAYENGGLFLLDELDASDANVLLTLNTIENGFISFPDKIVYAHPNFRLCATANPFDDHSTYTGRSKLDFSTIDRYFVIELERDDALEISLTSPELFQNVTIARSIMHSNGVSKSITMRDSIRMHKLEALNITECVFKDIAFNTHPLLYQEFTNNIATKAKQKLEAFRTQTEAVTISELWDVIQREHSTNSAEWKDLDTFVTDRGKPKKDITLEGIDRELAFKFVQSYISTNSKSIPPKGWNFTISPTTDNPDETIYTIFTDAHTHTFLSSAFIPF